MERKLGHWDAGVREGAAALLGVMAGQPSCAAAVCAALPQLRLLCAKPSALPEARHGALLALARVLPALATSATPLPVDYATIVPELDAARLFRGKAKEKTKAAFCFSSHQSSRVAS